MAKSGSGYKLQVLITIKISLFFYIWQDVSFVEISYIMFIFLLPIHYEYSILPRSMHGWTIPSDFHLKEIQFLETSLYRTQQLRN
jgi:hypothetical protein